MIADNLETLDTFTTKQDVTVTGLVAQMETLRVDGAQKDIIIASQAD